MVKVKKDTVQKAIRSGRLELPETETDNELAQNKSHRSVIDSNQKLGKSCTNVADRVLACKTGVNCLPSFSSQVDLEHAGVLLSLPALLSNGLLRYTDDFETGGYYSVSSVFLSLAFLSLLRVKTLAQSGSILSGELGRAIGLDRIPEVKTLRKRIALFSSIVDIELWSSDLSRDWMQDHPELSGILYIDGHVNVYFGKSTKMPRRYVSRLRLCMSGSTDYWVNDMTGQPYFVINKTINGSMIQMIKDEILPRLDIDVPNQPEQHELETIAKQHRYMIVFDRECYSPDFFYDLWQKRIAVCTYKKNVKDKWPEEEFQIYEEKFPSGEEQKIELAERGVLLEGKTNKKKIWVREIRKKTKSGHQTSIITTNYMLSAILTGIYMFARWSQENFFKYMMENFCIDTLVSYLKTNMSDTSVLVNPKFRKLDNKQKSITSKLNRRKAKFATMELKGVPLDEKSMKKYIRQKSELKEEIIDFETDIQEIKQEKKYVPKKITFSQLPENEKFDNVINERKQFLDTIKMIAYRAETAMTYLIKPKMSHPNEARLLLKKIYKTDANIYPDYKNKILTIEIHRLTYHKDDKILQHLCNSLNLTETKFPGTDLKIFYKPVSF